MRHSLLSFILVLYGASWCHYCTAEQNELQRLGIPFIYKGIEEAPAELQNRGIPIMVNDNNDVQVGLLTGDELRIFANGKIA